MTSPAPVPTQVRRPWRATFRTAFQFVVAFAVLLPFIVDATGLEPEVYPWLGGALAIAAGLTRVMALPQVEAFLQRFAPFLAAAPKQVEQPCIRTNGVRCPLHGVDHHWREQIDAERARVAMENQPGYHGRFPDDGDPQPILGKAFTGGTFSQADEDARRAAGDPDRP